MNWLFPQHVCFVLFGADFSEFSVTLLNKKTRQFLRGRSVSWGHGLLIHSAAPQLILPHLAFRHPWLNRHQLKRRLYVFTCSVDNRGGISRIQLRKMCSITWVNQSDVVSLLLEIKINVYFQERREWLWLTEDLPYSVRAWYNCICIVTSSATDTAPSRKQKSW